MKSVLKWILPLATAVLVFAGIIMTPLREERVVPQGRNAMWLHHSWVREDHTSQEYLELSRILVDLGITDAYFRSGPFWGDGTVPTERYVYAGKLLQNMKALVPELRCYAWLGQIEAKAGGPLDLSLDKTRWTIVKTVEEFLDLGFDGVHYDIEPIRSGNRDFLALLDATRNVTRAKRKLLSIASSMPEPVPGMEASLVKYKKLPGYWTKEYFVEVASRVDQIAIMSYDTASSTPAGYRDLIARITEWLVEQRFSNVLIGVPTYDEITEVHDPAVENMENALLGLIEGVEGRGRNDRRRIGAAIFAEWTTSPQEQQLFKEMWLGRTE